MQKTIGIIGGMGPLATYDLFKKIIDKTDAKVDQEHVRICIDCNTNIPDRTKAIVSGGENPIPEMVKSGIRLQSMGADVLVMPCNTAHFFYEQLVPFFNVPLLNMLTETAIQLHQKNIHKVGLLATDGTLASNVYHQVLTTQGIQLATPSARGQASVMNLIYNGVKAANWGLDLTTFHETLEELFHQGAELLLLGCTELPLAFEKFQIDKPIIDPTTVLAEAAIRFVNAPLVDKPVQHHRNAS